MIVRVIIQQNGTVIRGRLCYNVGPKRIISIELIYGESTDYDRPHKRNLNENPDGAYYLGGSYRIVCGLLYDLLGKHPWPLWLCFP